jgi:hypothetical protein
MAGLSFSLPLANNNKPTKWVTNSLLRLKGKNPGGIEGQ